MLDAGEIRTIDEILLLSQAASMVDGRYHDIYEALEAGVRASDIVALATRRLLEMDSRQVGATNSMSGERCSPHPRVLRPSHRPGLQFGHGLGLELHERPVISEPNSLEHPAEIEEDMVFALETCWPVSDGLRRPHRGRGRRHRRRQ